MVTLSIFKGLIHLSYFLTGNLLILIGLQRHLNSTTLQPRIIRWFENSVTPLLFVGLEGNHRLKWPGQWICALSRRTTPLQTFSCSQTVLRELSLFSRFIPTNYQIEMVALIFSMCLKLANKINSMQWDFLIILQIWLRKALF